MKGWTRFEPQIHISPLTRPDDQASSRCARVWHRGARGDPGYVRRRRCARAAGHHPTTEHNSTVSRAGGDHTFRDGGTACAAGVCGGHACTGRHHHNPAATGVTTTSATATPPAQPVCSEGAHQQSVTTTVSPAAGATSTTPPKVTSADSPSTVVEQSAAPVTTTPAAEEARPGNGKKAPYSGKATENPKAKIAPGQMRSDREEIPEGFTKADADKAETMEAALSQKQASRGIGLLVAPGCQVYWPAPYEVCGAIKDKYNSLGAQFSFLLWPTTNELTNPDGHGKRSQFQNGPIYWSVASGAHPVVNHFMMKWGQHNWETGYLGYPTTDEFVLQNGRRQEFQGGTIYWSPASLGAIGGAIRDKYNSLGAEAGWLSYPITDELSDGTDGRYNEFLNGRIYWSPSEGAWAVSKIGGMITDVAQGGQCTLESYPANCQATPDPFENMLMCELIRDDQNSSYIPTNKVIAQLVGSANWPSPMPITCGRFRHISDNHNAHLDLDNFAMCLQLALANGVPWDGANSPNVGIKWKNSKTGVWVYMAYAPGAATKNALWTAYTSGDSKDWGGCAGNN